MKGSRLLVFLVVLTLVVLLNLPAAVVFRVKAGVRDSVTPYENVLWYLLNRGLGSFAFFADGRRAMREKELVAEVARLRERVRQLQVAERDNAALRRMAGFARRRPNHLVLCEVVARGDATGWWQTLTLNRGGAEGVQVDQAVVTTNGLVGRVAAVARHRSTVLLVTDPSSKVACRLPRTGSFGIARGGGLTFSGRPNLEMLCAVEPLDMNYVPADAELEPGDLVVTSGLGGIYPEGLTVGRVVDTLMDASGLYQRADVRLAVHLAELRYVFVIQR